MDIARLGLQIETVGVEQATQKLDKMTTAAGGTEKAAGKVERATDSLGRSAKTATQQIYEQTKRMMDQEAEFHRLYGPAMRMVEALDRLEKEERAAAASAVNLSTATGQAAAQAAKSAEVIDLAQRRIAMGHSRGAAGAKLQAHEVTNLGRQFADIGVMLGSGQNPFMTLLQQGPQIADIMHSSGLGVKDFAKEIGLMTGILRTTSAAEAALAGATAASVASTQAATLAARELAAANVAVADTATAAAAAEGVALAPLGAFLVGAAGVAAVLGGGFLIAANEANKATGKFTEGLHLTDEQLKRVKKSGVETDITFGDSFKATFQLAGGAIVNAFEGPLSAVSDFFGDLYKSIITGLDWTMERYIGAWSGGAAAVTALFKNFPAVVGDAAITGVNLVLAAVERMADRAVSLLNSLSANGNKAAGALGLGDLFGTLKAVDLGQIKNPFVGAMEDVGKAGAEGFRKGFDIWDQMKKDWLELAEASRDARVKEAAGDAKAIKSKHEETAAARALREAMEDLLSTRRAGLALDATWQKEMNGRRNIDPEAELAKQANEQLTARLLEQERAAVVALKQQQDLAKTNSERVRLGREIIGHEVQIALASKELSPVLASVKEAWEQDFRAAFDDFNGALANAANAIDKEDWGAAAVSLYASFKTLEWANLSSAGKIGAVAGVAQVAGQIIGGRTGSVLGGAAGGALAGAQFGPVGAVVGGLIGGIGSLLSSNKEKKRQREAEEQAEAQRVADIAAQHRQLEISIMEASGDAVGALAARRADELKGIDASNQALAEQFYAAQDAAEAAAKAKELAASRYDLETELMRAQGNELGAVNRERAKEVEALDASLQGLKQAVWAAQALQAANDNLASSLTTLADLQQQQALQAQQNAVTALQGIAQAAEQAFSEASARVDDARSALNAAYEKEAGGLQSIIDGLRSFAASVHAFREQLAGELMTPGQTYGATRSAFYAAAANPGDDASGLLGAASTFLDASKSNARTLLDFQRDQAGVSAALKLAEDAAGEKIDISQRQLDALNASVQGLVTLNASVMSVQDAISGLASATAAMAIAQAAQAGATSQAQQAAAALQAQQAALQASQQAAALAAAQQAVNDNAAAGGFNAASYLRHYTDVQGEYDRLVAAGERDWWGSNTEFADWHWINKGKGEGRTPYALGGAFTGPVMDILSRPTQLGVGIGGEAGEEAIMPLERGSDGSLGVRARGGDNAEMVEELRSLRAEVAAFRAEQASLANAIANNTAQTAAATDHSARKATEIEANTKKTARDTGKMENTLTRVTEDGDALRTVAA